ncbi:hypothetical protein [Salarchaeum sp. JOR-1]|uniref:hypothetical protein n=1 Tax=Salarchaeum sp. JOR-1 TaxID=2599399 RepID=UPI0011987BCF|nr:hypothetical protein [Salarchaeum sp. JOR-1]QDX40921.1 hypothetical protein FQU85_08420 [Salarchaeum sp. JOR-1]
MPSDHEKRDVLREVASDLRDESDEGEKIAAILQRVSDLYDETEDTSPQKIYLNMRNILQVSEQGGLDR